MELNIAPSNKRVYFLIIRAEVGPVTLQCDIIVLTIILPSLCPLLILYQRLRTGSGDLNSGYLEGHYSYIEEY